MSAPIICFGQQPSGFFPKRYLVAKVQTARRLQREIGGEIVFFYHDSDHDPRETRIILHHRKTNEQAQLNFTFENRIQRKFSPLYLKRIPQGWQEKTALQLPNYVERSLIEVFKNSSGPTVADFCLEMYHAIGLLDGIKIIRSSDPDIRRTARDISDFYADIPYGEEIVRARRFERGFRLHEGGTAYVDLPLANFTKEQISPTRDSRVVWMQSVIHCTHYISGKGEQAYINKQDAPEINFVERDEIDRADDAYTDFLNSEQATDRIGAQN